MNARTSTTLRSSLRGSALGGGVKPGLASTTSSTSFLPSVTHPSRSSSAVAAVTRFGQNTLNTSSSSTSLHQSLSMQSSPSQPSLTKKVASATMPVRRSNLAPTSTSQYADNGGMRQNNTTIGGGGGGAVKLAPVQHGSKVAVSGINGLRTLQTQKQTNSSNTR